MCLCNCMFQQLQWHSAMLTLVLVLAQSIWLMLAAVVVRVASLTAHITLLSAVTLAIQRMLEWGVKVVFYIIIIMHSTHKMYRRCMQVRKPLIFASHARIVSGTTSHVHYVQTCNGSYDKPYHHWSSKNSIAFSMVTHACTHRWQQMWIFPV